MSGKRVFILLAGMLLLVCLVFSITALTSLRNALEETEFVKLQAEEMLAGLQNIMESNAEKEDAVAVIKEDGDSKEIGFMMKICNEKVVIFTLDGLFVRELEFDIQTLTQEDRVALEKGIIKYTWQEMLYLIDDFCA